MLSWQIFVTDIILFDGILAGEKYNITRGGASTTLLNFFATAKIYIWYLSIGRGKWENGMFFQYFDLFSKGSPCPHNNNDDWDWERDVVTLFVLTFKSVGAVIASKH